MLRLGVKIFGTKALKFMLSEYVPFAILPSTCIFSLSTRWQERHISYRYVEREAIMVEKELNGKKLRAEIK